MKQEQLSEIIEQAQVRRERLTVEKGREYVRGSTDRLANFKRIGDDLNLDPLEVWYVYFKKHFDALVSFIVFGKESSSEGIEGRIDDMQVYLDLLRGLVHERKEAGGRKPRSLADFQANIGTWQRETFGAINPSGQLKKLVAESSELDVEFCARGYKAEEKVRHEAADVAIVLAGFCEKMGFDLGAAISEKMEINRARKWGPVLPDGTHQHISQGE